MLLFKKYRATFGSQKFRFARKMIEKYLGACIAFQAENEKELIRELRRRLKDNKEQHIESYMDESVEREKELPPEVRAEILGKFHEQHNRHPCWLLLSMINSFSVYR